jgi:6-phosphogluconolactonase
MHSTTKWSRRTFLSTSGFVSASALIPPWCRANPTNSREIAAQSYLACTLSHDAEDASHPTLHAYVVENGNCRKLASMQSDNAIGAVAIHPRHRFVYVAHDTASYLNLPGASVSSFALDEFSGEFVQISREPLSLSATHPRHMAISPDGRILFVSATGGGAYNALLIAPDGRILPHPRVLKLARCGPHPLQSSASPFFASFTRSGRAAYACDFGGDCVDRLRFAENIPSIESTLRLAPGTGPVHLATHPSQRLLAVVGSLRPTLTLVETDARTEALSRITQQITLPVAALEAASFSPSGHELSVAGRTKARERMLFTFEVNAASLTVKQTGAEYNSHGTNPHDGPTPYGSAFPQTRRYSLVATNVPAPYSPMVTSPENVLPAHFPTKTYGK